MKKIGRNDSCPSGSGEKFKKCLAAHSCLHEQSSASEIWWVCGRWQAQTPDLQELHTAMNHMAKIDTAKIDAFLDLVFSAPPTEIDFWRTLIIECGMKRYPDVPGLFRRISTHLSAAGDSDLPWIYSSAAIYFQEDHPEMFSDVLTATLALDPSTTLMESLEIIVGWADNLGRMDDCDQLREHFPEFPEYMLEFSEDEEETESADSEDRHGERESEFPPEVNAALDKAWEDFQSLDSPTHEQAAAFVEELLALPHEATSWNDVLSEALKSGHADLFKIFYRLGTALSPTLNNEFSFVCWGAVEQVRRLKTPECLPEIARALFDFNPELGDPDAPSHIADSLLAHDFVNEMIELMMGFLPSMRESSDVLSWVVPRVAEDIFLLRLGLLVASGDYSSQPIDSMIASLCVGIEDEISEKNASVPLRNLMQDGEQFSREHFMLPSSTKDRDKQQLLWDKHQHAVVEISRDEWQTENRDPAKTLLGLHMILRAAEYWINSTREKGQKYPPNLLDYLTSAGMERLILIECRDMLGLNRDHARLMGNGFFSLIHWASRQGILTEMESEETENHLAQLMKQIED